MTPKQEHSNANQKAKFHVPPAKNTKPKTALRQLIEAYAILSGMGFYFCAVLGITIYLGHLADETFALGHIGKLIGAVIGFPLAIFSLWRRLKTFHL